MNSRIHSRRVVGALAALTTIGLLAACSSTPAAQAEKEVDLTVSVWSQDEKQLALFQAIADEFAESSPLVASVRFDSIPFDSYNQSLAVRLSGGDAPDLGWVSATQVPEYVDAGVLEDLTEAFKDPDYDYADVADTAKSGWTIDGAVYGYQFSTAPDLVYFNADAFKKAGLPTPLDLYNDGKWTWDAFADSAKGIVDSKTLPFGAVIGGFDFAVWRSLAALFQAYGAEPWSDGATSCGFSTPEMAQAMSLLQRMVYTDKSHPAPGQAADFFAGTAAMTTQKPSAAANLDGASFAWDVVPDPSGPAGYRPAGGKAGMSVFSGGKYPEAATAFLKYWSNADQTARMAAFFPPARASALNIETLEKANPLFTADQIDRVIIKAIPEIVVSPSVAPINDALLTETAKTALEPLWAKGADVKAVLADACAAIEPLLNK